MNKTLVLSAGGTGGHLMPAIAVAEEAKKRGYQVVFVVGGEKVPGLLQGFTVQRVHSGEPLSRRKGALLEWGALLAGVLESLYLSLEFPGDVKVLAAGSFASAPLLIAMSFLGCSFYLLEQNAVPGKTVRLFSRRAKGVFLSFREAERFLPGSRTHVTGNPLRARLRKVRDKEGAKKSLGLPRDLALVLVLGGSLGALSLVEETLKFTREFPEAYFLIQTGERNFALFNEKEGKNFKLVPFLLEMDCVYSATDVALSRAGGTAIAEMAFFGIPLILVPFPHATMNHQRANAEVLKRRGACLVVEEKEFSNGALKKALRTLLEREELRSSMSSSFRGFSRPQAASEILDRMEE